MKLFMMVGLPASGKSFCAEELKEKYDVKIFSSDAYREIYQELSEEEDFNQKIFSQLKVDIINELNQGNNVVYDATNLSSKKRRNFLTSLNKIDKLEKICVLIMRQYENCLKANAQRERVVPEEAILKYYKSFNIPYMEEGWDKIWIIYTDKDKKALGDFNDYLKRIKGFTQDNPYHDFTLDQHCLNTFKRMDQELSQRDDLRKFDMLMAALFHDNGKPFCKSFRNTKGEISEHAHYYGHEHVGAYDVMFYNLYNADKLFVSFLIDNHMLPHEWDRNQSVKSPNRYKRYWGEENFKRIMLLAKCDNENKSSY